MDEKEKKKRLQVNFRLNEEEANALETKANLSGLSVTAYAKKQALEGKVVTSGIKPDEVKEIISALGHIGGNINQIAKIANQGGGIQTLALIDINKNLDDLWTYIRTGKKQRKPVEYTGSNPDVPKMDANVPKIFDEHNHNKQANQTPIEDDSKKVEDLFSSPVKQDTKSITSSMLNENHDNTTPICKLCHIEMVKKQVKSGKNEGRLYWACPKAVYGDSHEFGGWV